MKTDYGLRALIELAGHYGQGLLQSSEIASRQSIPEPYLDQLLTTLRKAGLVRSSRGPRGGHSLAKEPEAISVTTVILTLEGSVAPISYLDQPDGENLKIMECQRGLWEEVRDASTAVTDRTSVADLADRYRSSQKRPMYYI